MLYAARFAAALGCAPAALAPPNNNAPLSDSNTAQIYCKLSSHLTMIDSIRFMHTNIQVLKTPLNVAHFGNSYGATSASTVVSNSTRVHWNRVYFVANGFIFYSRLFKTFSTVIPVAWFLQ